MLVVMTGCFDEGDDAAAKRQAAQVTAEGMLAFADIHNNIQTDPALAGEALLEFMKMPIAANNLIAPPISLSGFESAMARRAPATPVPECVLQTGEPACDDFSFVDCEAGGFSFSGFASRRCSDCNEPESTCSYGWNLRPLVFKTDELELTLRTSGHWSGAASQVTPSLSVNFKLRQGSYDLAGGMNVCACSAMTVMRSNTPSGKPKKLVNSSFLVTARVDRAGAQNRCALVKFDALGEPEVFNSCECDNGTQCTAYSIDDDPPNSCGNGVCEPGELEYCPPDCDPFEGACGDGICQLSESLESCPGDCNICGDGICVIAERDTCAVDCAPPTP